MNHQLKNKSNYNRTILIILINKRTEDLKNEQAVLNHLQKMIIQNFIHIINKAYPVTMTAPSMVVAMNDLKIKKHKSMDELRDDISKILFRIYFSEGIDKVYDFYKKESYDDKKCQALFDNGIYLPEEWLEQLMRCLFIKKAEEDMILHNLTPEWLWSHCFRLLIELYELTKQQLTTK